MKILLTYLTFDGLREIRDTLEDELFIELDRRPPGRSCGTHASGMISRRLTVVKAELDKRDKARQE